jgi:hypothetical protein
VNAVEGADRNVRRGRRVGRNFFERTPNFHIVGPL